MKEQSVSVERFCRILEERGPCHSMRFGAACLSHTIVKGFQLLPYYIDTWRQKRRAKDAHVQFGCVETNAKVK